MMNTTMPILSSAEWQKRFIGYCESAGGCEVNAAAKMVNDLDGLTEDQKIALERFVSGLVFTSWSRGLSKGSEIWSKFRETKEV